jgi:hypothetical protein
MPISIDLVGTYFPELAEIPQDKLTAVRARLVTWMSRQFPDEDLRPNTVLGDAIITRTAYLLAALETGMDRFASDTDPEQVAQGKVFNCDFVKAFYRNFGSDLLLDDRTVTTVRLVFNSAEEHVIPGDLELQFGDITLHVMPTQPGNLYLRPPGAVSGSPNEIALIPIAVDQFAADIPVWLRATSQINTGTVLSLDRAVTGLISATTVVEIPQQTTTLQITRVAEATSRTSYAPGVGLRGQLRRLVAMQNGNATLCSPVMSGDDELLRDRYNAFGMPGGAVDVHVSNTANRVEETLVVWCQRHATGDLLVGRLSCAHPPVLLRAVTATNAPQLATNFADQSGFSILTRAIDPLRLPGVTGSYGTDQNYWIVLPVPRTSTGTSLIPLEARNSTQGAYLTVRVLTDSTVSLVQNTLRSSDVAVPGLTLQVRRHIPLIISRLKLRYRKQVGRVFNRTQAITELLAYFGSVGHPDTFTEAKVADILFYAGARAMIGYELESRLPLAFGTHLLTDKDVDPEVTAQAAVSGALLLPSIRPESLNVLNTVYVDPDRALPDSHYGACGPRNLSVLLETSAIVFEEVA